MKKEIKFDLIIGNPPYQLKVGDGRATSIWDKFIFKTFNLLKENGELLLIHPGGWKEPFGKFKNVQNLFKQNNLKYLNINDLKKGIKIFGASTDFDWYVLEKSEYSGKTTINFEDEHELDVDISTLDFIPTKNFNEIKKILPIKGEEKVDILYSRTAYGHDKTNISKVKTNEFKHSVVYYTYKDYSVKYVYSNTTENGHFGIPKVIFTDGGASTPLIDEKGDYGLCDFAYGIIDKSENLNNIKKVLENKDFINLIKPSNGQKYNRKIISCLKKDFWKEFI